jgi:hypothetical protein
VQQMPNRSAAMTQRPVDLRPYLNNVGVTTIADTGSGHFNVWRNSFAAEDLPDAGVRTVVEAITFQLPDLGSTEPDNVRCDRQYIPVPSGYYDWLYVLGAAERRVEDLVGLHFADGTVDFEPLRLTDFWAAPPAFGETLAFQTLMHYPQHVQFGVPARMWCQRVPVVRRARLTGLRLPANTAAHVFAATLVGGLSAESDRIGAEEEI